MHDDDDEIHDGARKHKRRHRRKPKCPRTGKAMLDSEDEAWRCDVVDEVEHRREGGPRTPRVLAVPVPALRRVAHHVAPVDDDETTEVDRRRRGGFDHQDG